MILSFWDFCYIFLSDRKYVDDMGKNDIIEINKGKHNMQVSTNGKRNEDDLTPKQISDVIDYAVRLGMPKDRIYYVDYDHTAYGHYYDLLRIGTDVYPLDIRTRNPNDNISYMGAIAHELVGHREAAIKGKTNSNPLIEEVQASIRAARFAPELSQSDRCDLIRDALSRLKKEGLKICDVKDSLFIYER